MSNSQDPYKNPYHSPDSPPIVDARLLEDGQPLSEGDATGGLIPYKNPQALMAYYLGIFSLIPCIGLLLAIPAFILGILGLRARNRNPVIKGGVHAWIGIIMGVGMTLLWTAAIVFLFLLGDMTA